MFIGDIMANGEVKEKSISLVQRWGAGKIAIGTEFNLKGTNRTLTLISCNGYPNGKFVFDDGEEFNIGKYFDSFFVELNKSIDNEEQIVPFYDEESWNKANDSVSNTENSSIKKSFVSNQENRNYKDYAYYDVTSLIDKILKSTAKSQNEMIDKLYYCLINNNYPAFTKEKLLSLFMNCTFKNTKYKEILVVEKDGKDIGYLVFDKNKYVFTPKTNKVNAEYLYENNSSLGFFYTGDSYLDVALSTIKSYSEKFISLYHNALDKNSKSFGYQADSTIKTLLAFSCECYLKSMLISEGKNLSEIKEMGHGLATLFTSLDDDVIADTFSYMERKGYNLKIESKANYEENDLTEKFMLDLAKVDDAFIDARYCAENDKNTDYEFLLYFSLALRNSSKKKYMTSSPFNDSIENNISKRV